MAQAWLVRCRKEKCNTSTPTSIILRHVISPANHQRDWRTEVRSRFDILPLVGNDKDAYS